MTRSEPIPHPCATVELRLMHEADLPAYKALRDGMLEGHEDAFTSDAASERARPASSYRSRLANGETLLFTLLAWQDGALLGALTIERDQRSKVAHQAHLVGMMVSDAAQGRGIGRRLMDEALRLLRQDQRLSLLTLSVTASNAGAVRLYEGAGFKRYGRLEGAIRLPDGRVLDKDLMVLRLRD
ncbi:GNAT family N-acetyltransferase [Paucibacter sp. APW11]|uniref:GNAT family N-acetyltransferase n=1 Tax=Roseateles aquae TaxID=3077235 RepID=A0ABU3PGT9_9BURK|nr:GNAT family N-acetyltransferase [Paucibacter sp. APW11]MDT9001806.1 GNAT family N-acetyltransferase [Paucibacter sp. APW11]